MSVYILHLVTPLQHARHYVGFALQVEQRLTHHRNGTGARMLQVCNERGISYELARVWPGEGREFERHLKNTHNTADYCPICHSAPRQYHPKGGLK